ncbi:LysR family transcriptional regulator [Levilactobacillus bambusae]|uniref:LysR family transcriptional regulator n=1 Tax=Levilactobacillus bambusae TaxID=2024736 RepID=A0A2V1N087_9LACO|nr:LysR family transcriptional regulator [Levilactobacillus bambusae]PWF99759.1 LysR family transcriptional regulator [Levilactobacillus bambusae]
MQLTQLKTFEVVTKARSFGRAADLLHVTPSAVSHAIDTLERELGFRVFVRSKRQIQLTSDGQQIQPLIHAMLVDATTLDQAVAAINGLNSGSVRLGAFSSVCINWIPAIIQNFKRRYPRIQVSISQSDFNTTIDQIMTGDLDLGFSALPIKQSLEVIPLIKDEIYCVTPKSFIPANQATITQADIVKQDFILQQGDYDKDTKEALDHFNITAKSLRFSIDDQSIIAMVEAGMGFGVLPALALQQVHGNVNVYPFEPRFFRTICLVATKAQAHTPATRKMIQLIQDYVKLLYPDHIMVHN